MHGEGFFVQAAIYLAAAVISVPVAKKLGLGSVLGYLVAGIAIGPFALGLIGAEGQDVMHFAEFGVVMMLFLIGLELQPSLLWRMRVPILGLGGAQVGITAVLFTGMGVFFGMPWQSAAAIGMILALSSTAIVLQAMSEKGLAKTDAGQRGFAVLLFQDLAVIPILAILPILALGGVAPAGEHGNGPTWLEGFSGWLQTLIVLGTVTSMVVVGRLLVRPAFQLIAKTRLRELFTAASLLLVIGIALIMTQVGLSPALGTFVAGVVLADSEYRHELESNIEPFKGLLLGVFFIAVGASIDFSVVLGAPGIVFGLLGVLVLSKLAILSLLARIFRMGSDQNLIFSFSLAQGGEFAFVLFSFATQHNVLSTNITALLTVVVALSMGLTPVLMLLNEKLLLPRVGTREREVSQADDIEEENPVIIAGFGRFGNIVGRLLRAHGVQPTVLENDSDQVEVLRKLGLKVFYGDATRIDLLEAAGAKTARALVIALDDPDKTRGLVETAKRNWPHLTLLVRAISRPDAYELIEMGVEHVYRETLDTSLRMGVDVLRHLGARAFGATRAARTFRHYDERHLKELAKMRHDRKAYLSRAKERIHDLEQLLLEEIHTERERDGGWDTSSIRQQMSQKTKATRIL